MTPGEHLLALLDDTYILSLPQRARPLYNVMGTSWKQGRDPTARREDPHLELGIRPPDIDDLGEEVWSPEGVEVLGSSIGTGVHPI